MKQASFFLFLLSLPLLAMGKSPAKSFSYHSLADTLKEDRLELHTEFGYWNTTGYINSNGQVTSAQSPNSYSETNFSLGGGYGVSDKFELSVMGNFRQIQSENSFQEVTDSGLESSTFKAQYRFSTQNDLIFSAFVSYKKALFSNTFYTSSVPNNSAALGDDVDVLTLGGAASLRKGRFFLTAWGGVSLPSEVQSKEIPYLFELAYAFESFSLYAGLQGSLSLKTDDYTDNTAAKPSIGRQATFRYNAINQESLKPFGGINLHLSPKWVLKGEFSSVINGKSIDEGYEVLGGLTYRFGGKDPKKQYVESFKQYDLEGSVEKVSPRGLFAKIDKGVIDDIEKGQRVDIFKEDSEQENILIASGVVLQVKNDYSLIKILKLYNKGPVKEGMTARIR